MVVPFTECGRFSTMPRLDLPFGFIAVQLAFARRVSTLANVSLGSALIDCTIIPTLLNIEVTHETAEKCVSWQGFLRGLREAYVPDRWAYDHYVERERREPEINSSEGYGCFYYSYPFQDQPKVRLHFRPVDRSGKGALSLEQVPARRAELTALFREISSKHPDAETVRGGSWLYNIAPYCRLFPSEYIASMKPVGYELQFWALWGQFLKGGFRPDFEAIGRFCEAIALARTPEECTQCFPYEAMRPECDIGHFYRFFEI
jgi:hypothetical protein